MYRSIVLLTLHYLGLTFTNEQESVINAMKDSIIMNSKNDYQDDDCEEDIIKQYIFRKIHKPAIAKTLDQFCHSNEDYFQPFDCTDEIKEEFASLSDDEKEEYPTIQSFAENGYGYIVETDKNGNEKYVDYCKPNGRFDYWLIGGWWSGYLLGKDGNKYDVLQFDDVDWDNQLAKEVNPYWMLTIAGNWVENSDESRENMRKKIHEYIDELKSLPELERKNIVVYTIDIHD